jgi:hypothetical protein
MLTVIFGAGASFDSIPSLAAPSFPAIDSGDDDRPPLANELFANRQAFKEAMARFPACQPIAPYLDVPPGTSVESRLEHLRGEAAQYSVRHSQLAAVRFYLHFMLWECERRWLSRAYGITNHKTLLDQIERWRKPTEHVTLVTFNYDRIIEDALPAVGLNILTIDHYVSHPIYRLIKLHGSVDWGREVDTPIAAAKSDGVWSVISEVIERAAELTVSTRYRRIVGHPVGLQDGIPLFPAIAIPVETSTTTSVLRNILRRSFSVSPKRQNFFSSDGAGRKIISYLSCGPP